MSRPPCLELNSYLVEATKQAIASPTFSWTLPALHKDVWDSICFGYPELRGECQWLGDAAFRSGMASVLAERYPHEDSAFHAVRPILVVHNRTPAGLTDTVISQAINNALATNTVFRALMLDAGLEDPDTWLSTQNGGKESKQLANEFEIILGALAKVNYRNSDDIMRNWLDKNFDALIKAAERAYGD
jgi:hypothetical protein